MLKARPFLGFVAFCFVIVMAIAITGCGGGGGGGIPGTVTISGNAMTPPAGGGVAGFQPAQTNILNNLEPFRMATVEVRRFDNGQVVTTVTTDNNGYFRIPDIPTGTDLVFLATKTGVNIRLSSILADVSPTRNSVRLDPASTLASEAFSKPFYNQLKDISPNDYGKVFSEAYQQLQDVDTLDLAPGGTLLPPIFGGGLQSPPGYESIVNAIYSEVPGSIILPPSEIGIAKQIIQDFRDTQMGVGVATENASWVQKGVFDDEVSPSFGNFGDRMEVVDRWFDELEGWGPGRYQEDYLTETLNFIGNSPDNRTWIVEADPNDPNGNGMRMTVRTQNPVAEFSLGDPDAGNTTFQIDSSVDSLLDYHGNLNVLTASDGNLTGMNASLFLKDKEVTTPITFSGTISSQYLGADPNGDPRYKSVTFSGNLSSSDVTANFGTMRITWFHDSTVDEDVQKIELLNLSLGTRNVSNPVTISGSLTLDFYQFPSGSTALKAFSFTGNVSDPQTVSWSGSLNANWQNPKEDIPDTDIPIGDYPRGTLNATTTITPKDSAAFQLSFNFTSSPQSSLTADDFSATLQIRHGSRTLNGNASARLDKRTVGSTTVTSGDVKSSTLTFTSSEGYQLTVTWQEGQGATGSIKTAGGQQIATILHDPDLDLDIIRYNDGTWESVASALLDFGTDAGAVPPPPHF